MASILKKIINPDVVPVRAGTVASAMINGGYRVRVAGELVTATPPAGRTYKYGDTVRVRGTSIIGLRSPATRVYEV
jgi:hypothetical protein